MISHRRSRVGFFAQMFAVVIVAIGFLHYEEL